jgi:hypothetical protein
MLTITLIRDPKSLDYKVDPNILGNWDNQRANNSLDSLIIYNGLQQLFSCNAQTVSNMESLVPGVHFYDTIAPGDFYLRAFYDKIYPTSHYGRIHGTIRATTLNGDYIGEDSTTSTNKTRWEWHDWQSLKPSPQGHDTSVAWSAGCIVVRDYALIKIGEIFDSFSIPVGGLVPVHLEMK